MKIVVAVEDKVYAQAITDRLCAMTWDEKPEFKVVSAVPPLKYRIPTVAGVLDTRYIEVQEERRRAAKSLVLGVSSKIAELIPHARVEEMVVDGDAKTKILDLASEWAADIIVMGSHSRNDIERLFLGSTSLAVLSHSPCSVLIVKLAKLAEKTPVVAGAAQNG